MNRSFQSIAALLVSLSGAMLAVTWIPGEAPRPAAQGTSPRRRAAAVACGFVTSGDYVAANQPRASAQHSANSSELAISLSPLDLPTIVDRANLPAWSSRLLHAPAIKGLATALGSSLAPLWPLATSDDERRRVEEEYAAAELAAAAPRECRWLSDGWRSSVAALHSSLTLTDGRRWQQFSHGIGEQVTATYEYAVVELGLEEIVPAALAHIRRRHERLALREALLREMDRQFLKLPLDRDLPLPPKPQYRTPSRKLILATADALKSLSQTLNAAAETLERVSRHDVAELHTPVENIEEKR